MRLQCPNCDAEYEVDASAIPQEGRDVQCSNCGHGWFQSHPEYETDYELESALYDPPPPLPQGDAIAGAMPKRELTPEAIQILREEVALEEAKRAAEQKAAESEDGDHEPNTQPDTATETEPQSGDVMGGDHAEHSADDDIGDIEAALDAEYGADQQGDPAPIDAGPDPDATLDAQAPNGAAADLGGNDAGQPDLQVYPDLAPLPATEGTTRISARRVARLKGLNALAKAEADPLPEPAAAQPDWAIEPTAAPQDVPEYPAEPDLRGNIGAGKAPRKPGRRAGFYSAVLAALAAAATYVTAPDLAERLPQAAPYLEKYLGAVNGLRDQVQVTLPKVIAFGAGLLQDAQAWFVAQGWL